VPGKVSLLQLSASAQAHLSLFSQIVGLCILTPIAHDSYQIKNAISFVRLWSSSFHRAELTLFSQPDAPRGTSELLLSRVIEEMKAEGKNGLTFGTSATGELHPEANLDGWKVKVMKKGYKMINKKTGLNKRAEFRVSCTLSLSQSASKLFASSTETEEWLCQGAVVRMCVLWLTELQLTSISPV